MKDGQEQGPETNGSLTRRQVRDAASVLITLAALYLCWVLARPFLASITWSLALALIVPAAMVVQRLFLELGNTARSIAADLNSVGFRGLIERYPPVTGVFHWVESSIDLNAELKRMAGTLA